MHVSHFIIVSNNTLLNLLLKLFRRDVTLRDLTTCESNNFQHVAGADSSIRILDGIEVTNHVAALCSELHVMRCVPLTLIIYRASGASTSACVPLYVTGTRRAPLASLLFFSVQYLQTQDLTHNQCSFYHFPLQQSL